MATRHRITPESRAPARSTTDPAARLVRGLGLFSLALGLAQLLAPARTNRLIGVRDQTSTRRAQRLVGLQELLAAAGIIPRRRPVEVLWIRTASDVLHLALLAHAFRSSRASASRLLAAMGAVVGTFAADAFASARMSSDTELEQEGSSMKGRAAITIRAPREELAARWQEFEQSERSRLGPVEILSGGGGSEMAWRTVPGAAHPARGTLTLRDAPGDRGSEMHLEVEFDAPAGPIGAAVQKVAGQEPLQLVRDDLRRLKQLLEVGELARSDGSPTGADARNQPKQRPAQPLAHAGR